MELAPYLLAAFLAGTLPTAYLAGRFLKNVNIREHGSGNVGATNAFRVLGKGPGIAVLTVDFLKGALPVIWFETTPAGALASSTVLLCVGLAAVLGHTFTPFLGFKGGKGVATGAGMLAAGFPPLFWISLVVWGAIFLFTRTVSISSLGAVTALFVASLVLDYHRDTVLLFLAGMVFTYWTHRSNIGRLLRGEELKKVSKPNK